ncbi:MAG: response regulator [Myxococcales bacterium]|nr:response regulator [Myxococcales bacterium]
MTDDDARLRLLVVDDEPFTLKALQRLLKHHHVDVASSGREALELFERHGNYDVIVCDVMMPELTGVDVYRHVAQRRPGAEKRIVFVTGGAFGDEIVRFIESVPNELVSKPFDRDNLRAVVERVGRAQD